MRFTTVLYGRTFIVFRKSCMKKLTHLVPCFRRCFRWNMRIPMNTFLLFTLVFLSEIQLAISSRKLLDHSSINNFSNLHLKNNHRQLKRYASYDFFTKNQSWIETSNTNLISSIQKINPSELRDMSDEIVDNVLGIMLRISKNNRLRSVILKDNIARYAEYFDQMVLLQENCSEIMTRSILHVNVVFKDMLVNCQVISNGVASLFNQYHQHKTLELTSQSKITWKPIHFESNVANSVIHNVSEACAIALIRYTEGFIHRDEWAIKGMIR